MQVLDSCLKWDVTPRSLRPKPNGVRGTRPNAALLGLRWSTSLHRPAADLTPDHTSGSPSRRQ